MKNIFLKTDYFWEIIRKKLTGSVTFAFIFGSFAQGVEQEHSDIDLFVIGSIAEDDLIRVIGPLEKSTQREINYILWDVKTFINRSKDHHLLKTIKKGNIVMLIGDEHEFRKAIR